MSGPRKSRFKQYHRAISRAGYQLVEEIHNKHVKFRATHPETGEKVHTFIAASTPGDYRATKNFEALLQRNKRTGS